jgi:hypothetical protein
MVDQNYPIFASLPWVSNNMPFPYKNTYSFFSFEDTYSAGCVSNINYHFLAEYTCSLQCQIAAGNIINHHNRTTFKIALREKLIDVIDIEPDKIG